MEFSSWSTFIVSILSPVSNRKCEDWWWTKEAIPQDLRYHGCNQVCTSIQVAKTTRTTHVINWPYRWWGFFRPGTQWNVHVLPHSFCVPTIYNLHLHSKDTHHHEHMVPWSINAEHFYVFVACCLYFPFRESLNFVLILVVCTLACRSR
jgi:hypothetical protein